MAYPVLLNSREVVAALHQGRSVEPETQTKASDVDVGKGHLRALKVNLRDIRSEVERARDARTAFDVPAAKRIHDDLHLTRAVGADAGFWAYLSAVELSDVVEWRWNKEDAGETPPANRYLGGWKNTFQRLWFRAELARQAGLDEEPYRYVGVGGEDFWVGLLEREFSQCNTLVAELLRFWSEKESSGEASMVHHRKFFIVLRLLRPSRTYEAMSREECRALFDRTMEIATQTWVDEMS